MGSEMCIRDRVRTKRVSSIVGSAQAEHFLKFLKPSGSFSININSGLLCCQRTDTAVQYVRGTATVDQEHHADRLPLRTKENYTRTGVIFYEVFGFYVFTPIPFFSNTTNRSFLVMGLHPIYLRQIVASVINCKIY